MDKRIKQAKEMLKELEETQPQDAILKLVPSIYALGIMGIGISIAISSLKEQGLI